MHAIAKDYYTTTSGCVKEQVGRERMKMHFLPTFVRPESHFFGLFMGGGKGSWDKPKSATIKRREESAPKDGKQVGETLFWGTIASSIIIGSLYYRSISRLCGSSTKSPIEVSSFYSERVRINVKQMEQKSGF